MPEYAHLLGFAFVGRKKKGPSYQGTYSSLRLLSPCSACCCSIAAVCGERHISLWSPTEYITGMHKGRCRHLYNIVKLAMEDKNPSGPNSKGKRTVSPRKKCIIKTKTSCALCSTTKNDASQTPVQPPLNTRALWHKSTRFSSEHYLQIKLTIPPLFPTYRFELEPLCKSNSKGGQPVNQHCQALPSTSQLAEVSGWRPPVQQPPNSLPELFQVADRFFLPAML